MVERIRNFDFKFMARIYAWALRRFAYQTEIDDWIDKFLTGWFVNSGYEVVGRR